MKQLLLALTLVTSFSALNLQAAEVVEVSSLLYTSYSTLMIFGEGECKQAAQAIADIQYYNLSGEVSATLGQKIKDVQAIDSSLSQEEVLDLILTNAQSVLAESKK